MAYINKEDAKRIREALKKEFGSKLKFSVKRRHASSVDVAIKSGTVDFAEDDYLRVVDENSGVYDSVNQYYTENYKHTEIFDKIVNIIKTTPADGWFDKSDIQTDYFHTAFYFNISVGLDYDRPYKLVK